jgi:hypothetical protein
MAYDFFTVLELCAISGFTFWLVGFSTLQVAVRKGRREFRSKGYLRPPSGREWFRFLIGRHYAAFENSGARFFFGIAHFCLMGLIAILVSVAILLGCALLLKNVAGGPGL